MHSSWEIITDHYTGTNVNKKKAGRNAFDFCVIIWIADEVFTMLIFVYSQHHSSKIVYISYKCNLNCYWIESLETLK